MNPFNINEKSIAFFKRYHEHKMESSIDLSKENDIRNMFVILNSDEHYQKRFMDS